MSRTLSRVSIAISSRHLGAQLERPDGRGSRGRRGKREWSSLRQRRRANEKHGSLHRPFHNLLKSLNELSRGFAQGVQRARANSDSRANGLFNDLVYIPRVFFFERALRALRRAYPSDKINLCTDTLCFVFVFMAVYYYGIFIFFYLHNRAHFLFTYRANIST